MKILGIDTTTKFLCLGIYDGAKLYEYNLEVGRRLSSLLAPTIERVLDALGWSVDELDYFACGLGPGSFTGMRVGLSAIKGLAWSLNKPVVGVSTLDILARNIDAAKTSGNYVVPILDAKRGLIYCCVYKVQKGIFKRITPYMLLTERELLKKIKSQSIIFGDAVNLYKDNILKNTKGTVILDRDYWCLRPRHIIKVALEKIRGKKFYNPFAIKPIYLYPKECQIRK